jgi:hypothetical protein
MAQPKAPRDAEVKRKGFYIIKDKEIAASIQPDGRGIQFLYQNGRIESIAKIIGNITDETILSMIGKADGFRKLVHSIGIKMEMDEADTQSLFVLQMYGKSNPEASGTTISKPIKADGMEYVMVLSDYEWSDDDDVVGQIRFEFEKPYLQAHVWVKLYLNDGYDAPEPEEDDQVDFSSDIYSKMIEGSLIQTGNNVRIKRAIDKAKNGEDVTIAFIGGSITQGAGAIPINSNCYARKTFEGLCRLAGKGTDKNIHYVKAGVGGTPSELGLLRYDREVLKGQTIKPDIVVIEFAVNDEGDETNGRCYDSLARKIYNGYGNPAVILLFSVFADDYNLQERLIPVGEAYNLPMVSAKNAVTEQFYYKREAGRVLSKAQYFYDCYHPTNMGHTIMADCLINLFKTVDKMEYDSAEIDISSIKAPIGGEFEGIKLIDRSCYDGVADIDNGSFTERDEELQAVERDMDLIPTKEFPYNWHHKNGNEPFSIDIKCRTLLIIYKDSASPQIGSANVYADGKQVLSINPHIIGWTHCNALICFENEADIVHHIEVNMAEGEKDKGFTILGFGYL